MSQAIGQTATAFAWDDFLSLAVEWQANAASSRYPAAAYRSSISRAYYTVFHAAFDLATMLGLQSTGAGLITQADVRLRDKNATTKYGESGKQCEFALILPLRFKRGLL